MKKGKKALIGIGAVIISAAIGFGVYAAIVRHQSKKYNLTSVRDDEPSMQVLDNPYVGPVTESEGEFDVQLSEVKMHYEVWGEAGKPLILVHGNGGNLNSLREAAQHLANHYTVYVIESRCHGQSSDPGEISYDLMAKDIKEFCDALKLEKPYLAGHSDGGINAIAVAYTYPDLLGGFVSFGANSNPDTFKPYFPLGVRLNDIGKNDKLNKMMLTEPDFTAEKLSKITCPAYIVAGEYDIMWLSDTVFLHENIKDSRICIAKGENHSSYVSQNGMKAYNIIHSFIQGVENRGRPTGAIPTVTGKITEITDSHIVIESIIMAGYPENTLCQVSISEETGVDINALSIGKEVVIRYDGEIAESYPLQIRNASKITVK